MARLTSCFAFFKCPDLRLRTIIARPLETSVRRTFFTARPNSAGNNAGRHRSHHFKNVKFCISPLWQQTQYTAVALLWCNLSSSRNFISLTDNKLARLRHAQVTLTLTHRLPATRIAPSPTRSDRPRMN